MSKAGELLGMRQPAVSAALARLRDTFQDELFVRAAGAMQPTAKAIQMAPGVSDALRVLGETLTDAAPFTPEMAERSFTIASTDYTTLVLLPHVIGRIQSHAPGIHLRVIGYDKGDIAEMLDRGDIDLALGVFQDAPPRAIRKLLCAERFVGLCRRDHPLLKDGVVSLEAYAAAAHALVTVKRDCFGEIDRALERLDMKRRIVLTLPHMLTLPSILSASDLLSAVPERIARPFATDALQMFELPVRVQPWRIEMLWNAGSRNDRASAWLRSAVSSAADAA